jgi:hypothetical protein
MNFSIGKQKIPRLYFIIPVICFLGYRALIEGSNDLVDAIFNFFDFFEMAKIYNRCFFDPIHLFYIFSDLPSGHILGHTTIPNTST